MELAERFAWACIVVAGVVCFGAFLINLITND